MEREVRARPCRRMTQSAGEVRGTLALTPSLSPRRGRSMVPLLAFSFAFITDIAAVVAKEFSESSSTTEMARRKRNAVNAVTE
jgi:hypothetical protein